MKYNTNDIKPADRSLVIIQTSPESWPYVGKYIENDTFNLKQSPTVRINYNNAFIPWSSVTKWVYANDVFSEETL